MISYAFSLIYKNKATLISFNMSIVEFFLIKSTKRDFFLYLHQNLSIFVSHRIHLVYLICSFKRKRRFKIIELEILKPFVEAKKSENYLNSIQHYCL